MDRCLDIIGLSPSDCPCLPDAIEGIDPKASLSGQYIDNTQHGVGLNSLSGLDDCGNGNIWQVLDQIRKETYDDFATQFMLNISERMSNVFTGLNESIGSKNRKGNAWRRPSKNFVGFAIYPRKYRGVVMCINSIELCASNDGVYTVQFIKLGAVNETLETFDISVEQGLGSLNVNKEYPLFDANGQVINYALIYDRQDSKVKDFKDHCGCGSTPQPNWMKKRVIQISTIDTDDISKLDDQGRCGNSNYTQGLILNASFMCPVLDWVCNMPAKFWTENVFGRVMAKALVLLANVKLSQYLLNLNEPSFYTLLGREALYGKRAHYQNLVDQLIKSLTTKLFPDFLRDCYNCDSRSSFGFSKQGIIV